MEQSRICAIGRNCWRIARADRAKFLVDGDAYFAALAATLKNAQKSILIAGWQLDSRVRLTPGSKDSPSFGDFLHRLIHRNRKLRVYVLLWDFAMIYATDREIIPLYAYPWRSHRRIHFRLDSSHPVGASHHQKIVVVDNAVAFAGGQDIAERRWDTPDHLFEDPRRVDSMGTLYPPYHDVQLMVDGEAAVALGELLKERWRWATGRSLRAPASRTGDPWPPEYRPDLGPVSVAVSRTEPVYEDRPESREIEALHLDSIRAAQRLIYIENQYLTSGIIGDAIIARLEQEEGPEIVLVLPSETAEWLERVTMAVLRARLLKRLRAADRFGRLHLYYPFVQSEHNEIRVHSKVAIIDDVLVRVGSANLNNRSMGLDTECDLSIEACDAQTAQAIAAFRHKLLGEHLGVAPDKVAQQYAQDGSLARAIESLRAENHTLKPLDAALSESLDEMIPQAAVLDPERPLEADELITLFMPSGVRRRVAPGLVRLSALLCLIAVLLLFWRSTPLAAFLDPRTVSSWTNWLSDSPFAVLWVALIFTVGSLVLLPVTLLIVATGATFGPWLGFVYALCGCLFSAALTYGVGRLAGKPNVRRIAGANLGRVQRQFSRQGFLSMLFARTIPIAPFSIVNIVAGANNVRVRDFLLATVIGMAPGIFMLVVLEDQFEKLLQDPTIGRFALLLGLACFFAVMGAIFYRWYSRRRTGRRLRTHI
jgi:phospholipase D1/2